MNDVCMYSIEQQTCEIKPVNIQSRSPRTLMKRTSADIEVSIYPKHL